MKTKKINRADLLERITKTLFDSDGALNSHAWSKRKYPISDEDISTINELVGDIIEYFNRNKVEIMVPMHWDFFKGELTQLHKVKQLSELGEKGEIVYEFIETLLESVAHWLGYCSYKIKKS